MRLADAINASNIGDGRHQRWARRCPRSGMQPAINFTTATVEMRSSPPIKVAELR